MPYRIDYTRDADLDLEYLPRRQERLARAEVSLYLANQPDRASDKRKRLDPNPLGTDWALRLGVIRVYYSIDESAHAVWVERVGVKVRERVVVRGRIVDMRERP